MNSMEAAGEGLNVGKTIIDFDPDRCFKAQLMRAAYDTPSATIHEDFSAVYFKGYGCHSSRDDGSECTFAGPTMFLKQNVGLVSMGYQNSCNLEMNSPSEFKKAALGNVAIRAVRFGRNLLGLVDKNWLGGV